MAFNLENMTIDYKKMLRMIPSDRTTLAQSGAVSDLISSLTPGQLTNLFPRYYRDRLPDVGRAVASGSNLGGALSGGTSFTGGGRTGGGTTYTPPPPSKSAQELAVERILKENNIIPKASVSAPSETGFFGAIMNAEGTDAKTAAKFGFASSYDVVLGFGKYGLPDKPLSEMTISEVYDYQRNTLLKNHGTSSAAGAFQIVSRNILNPNGELTAFMERAGLTLNDKFDEAAQRKLAYEIYKEQGLGAWEGFKVHPDQLRIAQAEAENVRIESAANEIKQLESLKTELIPLTEEIRKQLDSKTLEIYDNAGPEQKWNIEQAIKAAGVQGFNEELKRQPINETSVNATSEKYSIMRGNIEEVNPKLQNVIMSASNDLPEGYTVKTISGRDPRATGTKNHPSGLAMDVQIYDNEGKLVPHNSNSPGWKYYEMLYRSAHLRGQEMYPEEKFIWGGAWISDAAGRGDPMHYQIVDPSAQGTSQSSGRYSIEGGLDPSHPFVKEGGQLSAKERESYDASVLAKIQAEKNASDPVTAAQSNMQQPPTELPAVSAPEIPAVAAPGLSAGGTVPMTPGENVAGINTTTGKLEFMSNDRELYTKDDNGNLRVDPSTIRQEQPAAQSSSTETQRLQPPNQPMQRKPEQPMPVSTPDSNFLETMSSGSMASSPSQLRALNRAKLYGENSGNLVNGHFS